MRTGQFSVRTPTLIEGKREDLTVHSREQGPYVGIRRQVLGLEPTTPTLAGGRLTPLRVSPGLPPGSLERRTGRILAPRPAPRNPVLTAALCSRARTQRIGGQGSR